MSIVYAMQVAIVAAALGAAAYCWVCALGGWLSEHRKGRDGTHADRRARERAVATKAGDRNVLETVAKLRRVLDVIEADVEKGYRVHSSVTGDPHVASDARDLVRTIVDRQHAYDTLALLNHLTD